MSPSKVRLSSLTPSHYCKLPFCKLRKETGTSVLLQRWSLFRVPTPAGRGRGLTYAACDTLSTDDKLSTCEAP